jgi:transposase-like protein
MAAPRKYPPKDAVQTIERLAADGYSIIGIARHLGVSRECFKRWIDEDEALNEAFELGRESERQALHAMVVASARANKPANVNAFFLLKARHGYVETDNRTKVNLDIEVSHVLVVKDHGDDAAWAGKCAAQQRALTQPERTPHQLDAPQTAQVDAAPYFGPLR